MNDPGLRSQLTSYTVVAISVVAKPATSLIIPLPILVDAAEDVVSLA